MHQKVLAMKRNKWKAKLSKYTNASLTTGSSKFRAITI